MTMTLQRRARMGTALAVLIVLGGCADSSSTTGTTPTTAPGTSDAPSSHIERLSERTADRTIQVGRGDRITLTLHNTYWRIGPADGDILTQIGSQQDSPAPAGTCVPGVGCGTVSAQFVATSEGSTTLTASRTTCGEAMACPPGEGSYVVHVVVS
jgi:hypothetical protein